MFENVFVTIHCLNLPKELNYADFALLVITFPKVGETLMKLSTGL